VPCLANIFTLLLDESQAIAVLIPTLKDWQSAKFVSAFLRVKLAVIYGN